MQTGKRFRLAFVLKGFTLAMIKLYLNFNLKQADRRYSLPHRIFKDKISCNNLEKRNKMPLNHLKRIRLK